MNVKTQRTLLASATRAATTACEQQQDAFQQHVRVYLNVTAASGTGGLTLLIRGYDKVSGGAVALNTGGGAAITTTGLFVFEFMPSANAAAGLARILPCVWDVQVQHGDASNYTYSVSCEVFRG